MLNAPIILLNGWIGLGPPSTAPFRPYGPPAPTAPRPYGPPPRPYGPVQAPNPYKEEYRR